MVTRILFLLIAAALAATAADAADPCADAVFAGRVCRPADQVGLDGAGGITDLQDALTSGDILESDDVGSVVQAWDTDLDTLATKDGSDLTGVAADTAAALAANGANCAAWNFPLGVDAAGAVEGCDDLVVNAAQLDLAYDGTPSIYIFGPWVVFDIDNDGSPFTNDILFTIATGMVAIAGPLSLSAPINYTAAYFNQTSGTKTLAQSNTAAVNHNSGATANVIFSVPNCSATYHGNTFEFFNASNSYSLEVAMGGSHLRLHSLPGLDAGDDVITSDPYASLRIFCNGAGEWFALNEHGTWTDNGP
jgi:hypothetical protein